MSPLSKHEDKEDIYMNHLSSFEEPSLRIIHTLYNSQRSENHLDPELWGATEEAQFEHTEEERKHCENAPESATLGELQGILDDLLQDGYQKDKDKFIRVNPRVVLSR